MRADEREREREKRQVASYRKAEVYVLSKTLRGHCQIKILVLNFPNDTFLSKFKYYANFSSFRYITYNINLIAPLFHSGFSCCSDFIFGYQNIKTEPPRSNFPKGMEKQFPQRHGNKITWGIF